MDLKPFMRQALYAASQSLISYANLYSVATRDETIRSSHDTIRIDTKGDDMVIFDTIRYG